MTAHMCFLLSVAAATLQLAAGDITTTSMPSTLKAVTSDSDEAKGVSKAACPDGSSSELSMMCRPCPSGMAGVGGKCGKCPQSQAPSTEMKLFLLTTSESCAADLPYGDDELTPEDSLAYFSMSEKGTYHNAWQQVILPSGRWSGDDVDYIMWNFDSVKTVEERLKSAAATGEVVHWVIEHKEKTIYKTGLWRFSDSSNVASAFAGSGGHFSKRSGAWGAATGSVNGYNTSAPSDFWGHGNFNSSDKQCSVFFSGSGIGSEESRLRNYISVQTLPKDCQACEDSDCSTGGVISQRVLAEMDSSGNSTLNATECEGTKNKFDNFCKKSCEKKKKCDKNKNTQKKCDKKCNQGCECTMPGPEPVCAGTKWSTKKCQKKCDGKKCNGWVTVMVSEKCGKKCSDGCKCNPRWLV